MSSDQDKTTIINAAGPDDPTVLVSRAPSPQPLTDEDPVPQTDPLIDQLLLNRYRIVQKIGSGGFGSVYRAMDELKKEGGEEHEIAIKTLDLDVSTTRLSGLIQEVSRSHTVTHPNILRVYDIHRDGDLAFITMELLVGQPLEDILEEGPLPEMQVNVIAECICDALMHCHTQGLIHSDIKPGNIFMCENGDIKLLDLGIAQMLGSVNQIAGFSPMYASPQQASHELPDPRDDIFSLCCVFYEALTGRPAFGRQKPAQALAEGIAPALSELPPRYRRALRKGLAAERDDRTATVAKLWSRINPAVRKRFLAAAGVTAIALIGFVVSNQIGEQAGMAAISVSEADQAAASTHYQQAVSLVAENPGEARRALVEALRFNPYMEDAAEMLVLEIDRVRPNNPQQFTLAWSDFVTAYAAAPTSEALTEFADRMTAEYSQRDTSSMSRLRVLSELRVPVCALRASDQGSERLAGVIESASISC